MLQGLIQLPLWGYIVVVLVLTHITIASVTIFLHRHQAHRALELHPVVSHFFRFWLWLTTGMETKVWTAIHRKHHARCETEEDPHSPQILGLKKVLLEGAELYRQEAKNTETIEKYGFGTPDDWVERHVYSRSRLGIQLMFVINLVLFGPIGITIWAVQMIWIPFWAAGVVNGVGHYWGYRNYETEDAAKNIVPWGILIGGEELHNNHHAFPSSAKLSSKPWEFDIGWLYIQILQGVGLAKVKRVAPHPVIDHSKTRIDVETARAVLINRFHVLAQYYRDVVKPTVREEVEAAPSRGGEISWKRLRRMRKLLVRDEHVLDEQARWRLSQLLETSGKLRVVYDFKVSLQAIWQRPGGPGELVQALQDWCRQAEATGIRGLCEFARQLRGYSLPTAAA